jgi:hypothetical protein
MLSGHNKDWQCGEKRLLRREKESGYSLPVLYQPPGSSEKEKKIRAGFNRMYEKRDFMNARKLQPAEEPGNRVALVACKVKPVTEFVHGNPPFFSPNFPIFTVRAVQKYRIIFL